MSRISTAPRRWARHASRRHLGEQYLCHFRVGLNLRPQTAQTMKDTGVMLKAPQKCSGRIPRIGFGAIRGAIEIGGGRGDRPNPY